jgi:signal transduction histidine kinase
MCLRLPERGSRARVGPPQRRSRLAFCRGARTAGASARLLSRSRCALLLVISFGAAIIMCGPTSTWADAEKRVLMLHSFGLRFKPWTDYAQITRAEITSKSQRSVEFHDHSLLTAGLSDDKSDSPFVDYLHALYAERPPHLIIAFGAPAANFIQRYRDRIFPTTPMLLTAVEQRRVQHDKLTQNDTVAATANDVPAAFENILRMLPLTKKVLIVSGASANEKVWMEAFRRELAPLSARIALEFYNELSFEDVLKNVASLPPESAIFWQSMNVDAAGVAHEANSALIKLAAAANAPIFSYLGSNFGEGIVGGPMHSVEEGSAVAAAVAVRILNGEKAGEITTPPTPFASPKYDWRQMQRWGISERRLPPGGTIHFKPPTLWELYRWQAVATAGVMLAQAALIIGLMWEHRRRRRLEVEGRQRMAELAHMNRQATAGQLSASIAHELNQPLGAILNNVGAAKLMVASRSPNLDELTTILDDIERDDERASKVIRRLRRLLTRGAFDPQEVDLNKVVRDVVRIASAQAVAHSVELDSNLAQQPLRVKGDKVQLQQVVLNLIVNGIDAIAESPNGVREIACRSWASDGRALVSIRDTGPGIPADRLERLFEPFFTTKQDGMGMGLCIAHTIIEAHGGKISAESRPSGAVFHVSLPLAKAKA